MKKGGDTNMNGNTFRFSAKKLVAALSGTSLRVASVERDRGLVYVTFTGANGLRYIRAPRNYTGLHNCINIHHGESTKSGFWWNHELNYNQLARTLEDINRESARETATC